MTLDQKKAETILAGISIAMGQGTSEDFRGHSMTELAAVAMDILTEFPDAKIEPYYFEIAYYLKELKNG